MTLYAEFVVCFDKQDEGECCCKTTPPHLHISICEAYHGEMGKIMRDEILLDGTSEMVQTRVMAEMCREAIKLNKEKPNKIG